MAHPALSEGSIKRIVDGSQEQPILQILGAKLIPNSDNERYRLLISDGVHLHSFAMLSSQLNYMFKEGSLSDFTIFRLMRFNTSTINSKNDSAGKRVIVILEINVLVPGHNVGGKIGNPLPLDQKPDQNIAGAAAPSVVAPRATSSFTPKTTGIYNTGASTSSIGSGYGGYKSSLAKNDITLKDYVIHPISTLTPYQNKWVIKGRISNKSNIRTWKNDRGEGKLFSFEMADQTAEIRATAFKDQVDMFYDKIEVDRTIYMTKCSMKSADKRFNATKHEYELTLNSDTIIQGCFDEDHELPVTHYTFVPISQIAKMEPNSMIDVIGVCYTAGDVVQFTARTSGRELKKREVTLVDNSRATVSLTLWGEDAENFDASYQPVIAIRGARVTEFGGGKTISLASGSLMKKNPDIPEGHQMRGWFDNCANVDEIEMNVSARTGGASNIKTDWITFHEAKIRNLGMGDAPEYFQTKAIVHLVRLNNCVYKSCPQAECNKKIIDQDDGTYRCEKCNASYTNFKYRFLVSMSIGDWTSNRWVTCFNEVAEQMFGKTAQEYGELQAINSDEAEALLTNIHFNSFIFKLRIKMEHFGDSNRNKINVVSATPINYKEYNEYLMKDLASLTGIGMN
ncbi:Replication protein A 70 kDa DNA-binding subunit [Sergentomyia squamirostris]